MNCSKINDISCGDPSAVETGVAIFLLLSKINIRFYDQNWGTQVVRETDEVLFRVTGL